MKIFAWDNSGGKTASAGRRKTWRTTVLCRAAGFLSAALALSYMEVLLPTAFLLPLPGCKLGLSHLAVLLCAYAMGWEMAASVGIIRCLVTGVLFANGVAFLLSLCGTLLSAAALWLAMTVPCIRENCSAIGVSALMAAAHMAGQLTAAALLFSSTGGTMLFTTYGGVALLASVVLGTVNGCLVNYLRRQVPALFGGKETGVM